ncbi:hypothetical protein PM3016_4440 [Paenibacillus mucilaginosus 3016]|uniref:Uncharacterized protein n=1 Tax=Paenibacillus mucilaginosus 3016 TaxID=1116391 RepID=H6NQ13_9BACL|nr:hypothetical protein PM3016_4440 [Paenibacillus mucilaginosus 3016]
MIIFHTRTLEEKGRKTYGRQPPHLPAAAPDALLYLYRPDDTPARGTASEPEESRSVRSAVGGPGSAVHRGGGAAVGGGGRPDAAAPARPLSLCREAVRYRDGLLLGALRLPGNVESGRGPCGLPSLTGAADVGQSVHGPAAAVRGPCGYRAWGAPPAAAAPPRGPTPLRSVLERTAAVHGAAASA